MKKDLIGEEGFVRPNTLLYNLLTFFPFVFGKNVDNGYLNMATLSLNCFHCFCSYVEVFVYNEWLYVWLDKKYYFKHIVLRIWYNSVKWQTNATLVCQLVVITDYCKVFEMSGYQKISNYANNPVNFYILLYCANILSLILVLCYFWS